MVEIADGRYTEGESHAAVSLAIFNSLSDTHESALALIVLARATASQHKIPAAVESLAKGLRLARRVNDRRLITLAVEEAVWVAATAGVPERVAVLSGTTDTLRDMSGFARSVYEQKMYTEAFDRLSARLDERTLTRSRDEGRSIAPEHIVDVALSMLQDLLGVLESRELKRSQPGRDLLSKREHEVLQLVAQGLSNKQIAGRLAISENTVKFHVTSILNKLGADSRAQIVALAAHRNLLDDRARGASKSSEPL